MKDHTPFFKRFIEQVYTAQANEMVAICQQHYERIKPDIAFAYHSPNPIDRRLDLSAYVLAYIKTLEQFGVSKEKIRSSCIEIVTAYVQPSNRWEARWKKIIPALIRTWAGKLLIGRMGKKVGTTGHTDGFKAKILTDKSTTYGFGYGIDILECGICKLFQRHNMSNYTSLLCEIDKITSGLAGLELIRTGTIANGAKICDFRFKPLQ